MEATAVKDKKYLEAVGRRKTAVARVRLTKGTKGIFTINDKELAVYFPTAALRHMALGSLTLAEMIGAFNITAKITGGGIHSQAEALRLSIARALTKFEPELRSPLKKAKLLSRDPRAKERRKFGLKKARKSPQWSKR